MVNFGGAACTRVSVVRPAQASRPAWATLASPAGPLSAAFVVLRTRFACDRARGGRGAAAMRVWRPPAAGRRGVQNRTLSCHARATACTWARACVVLAHGVQVAACNAPASSLVLVALGGLVVRGAVRRPGVRVVAFYSVVRCQDCFASARGLCGPAGVACVDTAEPGTIWTCQLVSWGRVRYVLQLLTAPGRR